MPEPFTMTHLLMAATAGAALPSILGGKGKGCNFSEEEKATYRGFKLLKMQLLSLAKKKKLHTEDSKLKKAAL
jgi:hypothetical protein